MVFDVRVLSIVDEPANAAVEGGESKQGTNVAGVDDGGWTTMGKEGKSEETKKVKEKKEVKKKEMTKKGGKDTGVKEGIKVRPLAPAVNVKG